MPVGTLTSLLASFAPGSPRDTFTGEVGMVFALTANMTFNQIGCRCETGDTSFLVTLRDNTTLATISSATITLSGGTVGNYYYADVSQFTLTAGTSYALVAQVTGFDGLNWADVGSGAIQNQASLFSAFGDAGGPYTSAVSDALYVGLDLDFSSPTVATSLWGKGLYGNGLYSRVSTWDLAGGLAPSVAFSANLDIVGQDFFAGDLKPVVSFAGALGVVLPSFVGDLPPQVTFSASLTLMIGLSGDLAPQAALGGALTFELPLAGDMPLTVSLAASSLTAGPLWSAAPPAAPPWTPSDPCPPSLWTPTSPCDPVDWEETETCNG